jgi:hypothetical protein
MTDQGRGQRLACDERGQPSLRAANNPGQPITNLPGRAKRTGNSLRKKRTQRYHEACHVSGNPLVLMIAPCAKTGAGFYPDDAFLHRYRHA